MTIDWKTLRAPAPASLVSARETAHYALEWLARAATANVPAVADDSHTALAWDAGAQALATQPMAKGARVAFRIADLTFVFGKNTYPLEGQAPGEVTKWLDEKLAAAGLQPASKVKLPYAIPEKSFRKVPELGALARWFAASAELLGEVRARHGAAASPVVLWPHHFDMATLVTLGKDKSIGIGISPGDHYYAQPYVYISPYPAPGSPQPPALPPGGHWHTKDFFGAVATADELLALADPRAAAVRVIEAAVREFLKPGTGS